MKIAFLYIHILSLAVAMGSMFIIEHLILAKDRKLGSANLHTIEFASRAIAYSLLFLWITGIGFVVLGYLADPLYIENQKIWAKVSIVVLMTINGIYLHQKILPRLSSIAENQLLIRNGLESLLMRLTFSVSLAGWLLATFYGLAKFLNSGYSFYQLFGAYIASVIVMVLLSYTVKDQRMNDHILEPLSAES